MCRKHTELELKHIFFLQFLIKICLKIAISNIFICRLFKLSMYVFILRFDGWKEICISRHEENLSKRWQKTTQLFPSLFTVLYRGLYGLLYVLSESHANFMSQSPLVNATKRGRGSGIFCRCCSGSKAAPAARMIKSEPQAAAPLAGIEQSNTTVVVFVLQLPNNAKRS